MYSYFKQAITLAELLSVTREFRALKTQVFKDGLC